jgi:hypothetical protein
VEKTSKNSDEFFSSSRSERFFKTSTKRSEAKRRTSKGGGADLLVLINRSDHDEGVFFGYLIKKRVISGNRYPVYPALPAIRYPGTGLRRAGPDQKPSG